MSVEKVVKFANEFMLITIFNTMISRDSINKNEMYREKEEKSYYYMRYALQEAGILLHQTEGFDIVEIRKMYYKLPRCKESIDECKFCNKYKKNIPSEKKRILFNYEEWFNSLTSSQIAFLLFCQVNEIVADKNPHKYHLQDNGEKWFVSVDSMNLNYSDEEKLEMSLMHNLYMLGDCPDILIVKE